MTEWRAVSWVYLDIVDTVEIEQVQQTVSGTVAEKKLIICTNAAAKK